MTKTIWKRDKKILYLLSHNLKWSVFKKLQKLVKQSGPVPDEGDRKFWEMMKDRQIYCGFRDDMPDDMFISLKLPKGYRIVLIENEQFLSGK